MTSGARVLTTDPIGMQEIIKFSFGPIRVDELRFADGSLYMRRWLFGWKRWYGIRLHNIVAPDNDREFHDHPFDFVSICLRGGYTELMPADEGVRQFTWHTPWRALYRRAEDLHRIVDVKWNTWTLVLRGPFRRTWGFQATKKDHEQ